MGWRFTMKAKISDTIQGSEKATNDLQNIIDPLFDGKSVVDKPKHWRATGTLNVLSCWNFPHIR
jgi:hypothetical protein